MQIKEVSLDKIIPYANNPRKNQQAIDKTASSIKEYGWQQPIVVDEEMVIIAGHTRHQAAQKLGFKTAPVHIAKGLTKAQVKAYRLADNRVGQEAEWDWDMLKVELDQLEELDFDLSLTGFDEKELADLTAEPTEGLTDEDAVPDLPEHPVTEPGDVWILGNHRLMCGDSTSIDAVEKLMGGKKADMVFTDPPYGMKLDADYSGMDSKFKGSKGGNKYKNVIGDHDDFNAEFINVVFALFGYCKEVFLWGADYYSELIPDRNKGSWVVWDKRGDESADKMFGSSFELCWSKVKHKRILARVKWAGLFGLEKEHDKKRVHPTQKPVELITWFFNYFSVKDKRRIVDLFGGSGSTLIACEKTNRQCFMMELDPHYCDVIINRWQDFTGKDATLESNGKKYSELKDGKTKN